MASREVFTTTQVQVHRPRYSSSIGRWRAFGRHLDRLSEAPGTHGAGL
jgi:hypothetical protein